MLQVSMRQAQWLFDLRFIQKKINMMGKKKENKVSKIKKIHFST